MTEDYLQIMIESLEKKNNILDKVIELDKRQLDVSLKRPFDMEAYDATMDEKGVLIDELGKLDDGFTNTFELVKDQVQSHAEEYKEQIKRLQELIRITVDKSVMVQAQEERNKQAMQNAVRGKRQEIRRMKISTAAASKYYKAMSRINDVDPQLMDRKK